MRELELHAKVVDRDVPVLQCACGKSKVCLSATPCTNLLDKTTVALAGTEGFKSMLDLEDHLVENGGEIVNVNNLTAYEIADSRSKGHLFLALDGTGFAWRAGTSSC